MATFVSEQFEDSEIMAHPTHPLIGLYLLPLFVGLVSFGQG